MQFIMYAGTMNHKSIRDLVRTTILPGLNLLNGDSVGETETAMNRNIFPLLAILSPRRHPKKQNLEVLGILRLPHTLSVDSLVEGEEGERDEVCRDSEIVTSVITEFLIRYVSRE